MVCWKSFTAKDEGRSLLLQEKSMFLHGFALDLLYFDIRPDGWCVIDFAKEEANKEKQLAFSEKDTLFENL